MRKGRIKKRSQQRQCCKLNKNIMTQIKYRSMAPKVGACETAFGSSVVTATKNESDNMMIDIISINYKYIKL